MVYEDYSPVCYTVALILGLTIVYLSYLFFMKLRRGPDYKGPGMEIPLKNLGVILVIVLMFLTFVVYGTVVMKYQRDLDIQIDLFTDLSGVVILPTSLYEPLERKITVMSGDATVSHVATEHGRGLRIEFNGQFSIEGHVKAFQEIERWEFSMPTEMNGNRQWILYEPEVPGDDYINAEIHLIRRHPIGSEDWLMVDGPLIPGWYTYEVDESFIAV